jgi:hypothetical protein
VLSSTHQSTDSPLLSTLYEPLPKHLISVLGLIDQRVISLTGLFVQSRLMRAWAPGHGTPTAAWSN